MMARQMKASGVDWMGVIPARWKMARGRDVFTESLKKVDMEKLPMLLSLTKKGVIPRRLDGSGKYPASFETYQQVTPGDFVFCLFDVAETPRTIGYVNHEGMITGAYSVFKVKEKHRFFEYLLVNIDDMKALQPFYAGMRNVIQMKVFKKLLYPLPPQQEQIAIAAYLDDRTTAIDRKIQLLQEKSTALSDLRKSVIHQAVTKGLDLNVVMKPSGVDWIGDIPNSWTLERLKTKVEWKNGQWGSEPTGVDDIVCFRKADYMENTIVSGATLRNYTGKPFVQKDDILIEKSGGGEKSPVGALAYVLVKTQAICSNFMARIRATSVLPRYCFYSLSAFYDSGSVMKCIAQTTGIQNLSTSAFLNNAYMYPNHKEQIAIATYLDERTAVIDDSIKTITEQITAFKSLRQSLIHEAVTGKINVADFGYKTT